MRCTGRHILLWGSLLGLLVGCGQVPGGAGISGTVRAPAGEDVAGTRVFACYENERGCASLGEVKTYGVGSVRQIINLAQLAPGSYGVYAFKDA